MIYQILSLVLASLLFASSVKCDSISFDVNSYGNGDPTPFQSYLSNKNVQPPELLVTKNTSGLADGFVFVGVDGMPTSGQNYPVIYEMSDKRLGSLIWTGNYTEPFDFRTQIYKGKPHLTMWVGELLNGYGHGSYYILNQSYSEITHFSAVGYPELGDLHEFIITKDDTALVTIYVARQWDLTEFGGPADGWIFECLFQEINIETNELVFEWNATGHVGLNESYNQLSETGSEAAPFDWFHINSVEKDANGDYLVSGRVMDCLYKISGKDGSIIWRLHGKQSDFDVEDAANFAFQHDARWVDDVAQNRITIFDNGPTNTVAYSRGLLLAVDQTAKTVRLIQEFTNGAKTFAMFEGCLQTIDAGDENSNYFLGFGNQPFFSELNSDGEVLLDAQFGKTNVVNSYRAYRLPWVGMPLTNPDIYYDRNGQKVYASWNGATEVEQWTIYTADDIQSSKWRTLKTVNRTGFETEIDLSSTSPATYVRAKGVDANGKRLGWSDASDGTSLFPAKIPDEPSSSSVFSSTSTALSINSTSTSTTMMNSTMTSSSSSSARSTSAARSSTSASSSPLTAPISPTLSGTASAASPTKTGTAWRAQSPRMVTVVLLTVMSAMLQVIAL